MNEQMLVCSCDGIVSAVTGVATADVGGAERKQAQVCRVAASLPGAGGPGSVGEKSERRLPLRGGMGWCGKGRWDFLGARPAGVLVEGRVILVCVCLSPLHRCTFETSTFCCMYILQPKWNRTENKY